MNILDRSIRFVPVILFMAIIFFLSHLPGSELQISHIPGFDKLAHACMYAVLAAAALYAAPREPLQLHPGWTGMLIVLFCLLYGVTDEYHQSFVPGRVASFGDLAADAAGATILVSLWLRYQKSGKAKGSAD